MLYMKKYLNIEKALIVLHKGGVIAHATETCYGFACDATNKKALSRLYRLKQMHRTKPVSILVNSLKTARKYGVFNKRAVALAKKYWPGPLTIVVKRKKSLPAFFNPGIKTIGIRVPGHLLSLNLARHFGKPLITTSANISGKSSLYSIAVIKRQFKNQKLQPDLYIESGIIKKNLPSTIVEVIGREIKIIRQGALILR